MTRVCTVCTGGRRDAIDRAILAALATGEDSLRGVALRFGVNRESLRRHMASCLVTALRDGWLAERERGRDPLPELAALVDRTLGALTRLLDACDACLRDPRDPDRYDLAPRAIERVIVDEDPAGRRADLAAAVVAAGRAAAGGAADATALAGALRPLDAYDASPRRPVRRAVPLADALARIDGHPAIGTVVNVRASVADPRTLLIAVAGAAGQQLATLTRLRAQLDGVSGESAGDFLHSAEWYGLKTRMLRALLPYPDARAALVAVLDEAEATSPAGAELAMLISERAA